MAERTHKDQRDRLLIQVGQRNPDTAQPYIYSEIPTDYTGWVDALLYLPLNFDLVYLKTFDRGTIVGWYSGTSWDGLHFDMDDEIKVMYWKRKLDD